MTDPKWILLSEALQLIANAADNPKTELLAAMRHWELAWTGFFEEYPPLSPELVPPKFRNSPAFTMLVKTKARQLKRTIKVSSADGYTALLANISPDSVDWKNSELIVPEPMRPRLYDICVERSGLERLWDIRAEDADPGVARARRLDERDNAITALVETKRAQHPELSGNEIAKCLHREHGDEFGLSLETFRKLVQGRYRNARG